MKYILVLGGSQFMGKSLLERLNDDPECETHYINRNKSYWNNEVKLLKNIHYTFGDRDEAKDFMSLLKYLSNKLKIDERNQWHTIIDFTGFTPKDIFPLSILQNKGNNKFL